MELDLGDMLAALEKQQQAMKARQLNNTKPLSLTGTCQLALQCDPEWILMLRLHHVSKKCLAPPDLINAIYAFFFLPSGYDVSIPQFGLKQRGDRAQVSATRLCGASQPPGLQRTAGQAGEGEGDSQSQAAYCPQEGRRSGR